MIFAERWLEVSLPNQIQVMGITNPAAVNGLYFLDEANGFYNKGGNPEDCQILLNLKLPENLFYWQIQTGDGDWVANSELVSAVTSSPADLDYTTLEPYTGKATVSGYVPAAPAITAEVDGDLTGVLTVTIAGDAGVTHTVLYKLAEASMWSDGGSRTGDGEVSITGLASGTYQVMAYSSYDGHNSSPSNLATATLAAAAAACTDGLFDDAQKTADSAIWAVFASGCPAVYTDLNGLQTTLAVIVGPERTEEDYDEQGRLLRRYCELSVRKSELASMDIGAQIQHHGLTYQITRILRQDASAITAEGLLADDTAKMEPGRVKRM
jgi:hypothetical protein